MWFLLWANSGVFKYVKLRKNDGSALIAYLSKLPEKPAGRPLPHGCTGVEIYRRGIKREHYYCHEAAFHIDYNRFRHLAAQLAEAGFVTRQGRGVYNLPLHNHVWLFSKINRELVVSLYGGLEAAVVDVNDVARLIDVFTSNNCVVAYHGERCNDRRCTESSFSIICKNRAANVIDNFVDKYKIRWGQDYVKFDVNVLEGMSIEPLLTRWEQNGEASRELVNVLWRLLKEGWLSRRLHVYKAELRGGDIDGDVAVSIMIAKEVLKKTALIFGRRIDFISDSIA
jgi:hypothetical protein